MSDEKKAAPLPLPPSWSPPGQSSPQSDQWLERVLSDISRGIAGTSRGQVAIKDLIEHWRKELNALLEMRDKRFSKRVADLQVEVGQLNTTNENLVRALQETYGTFIVKSNEVRQRLDDSRAKLDVTVKEFREETGKHALLGPEDPDDAPRFLQLVVIRLTNLGWKNKAKVVGWAVVAGASLWNAVERIIPYVHGWLK